MHEARLFLQIFTPIWFLLPYAWRRSPTLRAQRLTPPLDRSSTDVLAVTAFRSLTHPEEWDDLEWDVLKPSLTGSACMTCQHFRHEVGKHCVTLLTCPIHQGLIPQGEHLTRRCSRWVPRREEVVG